MTALFVDEPVVSDKRSSIRTRTRSNLDCNCLMPQTAGFAVSAVVSYGQTIYKWAGGVNMGKSYLESLDNVPNDEFMSQLLEGRSVPELYSDAGILRACVQMITPLGPLIDAILAAPGSRRKEERLRLFLALIYKGLAVIQGQIHDLKQRIDRLYSEYPEELEDIILKALESSIRTRSRTKIAMNAMILLNLLSGKNEGKFRPEEYLDVLSELSPIEVKIIATFYDVFVNDEQRKSTSENELQQAERLKVEEKLESELGLDREDILFLLKRIERTGLIREVSGMYWGYAGNRFTINQTLIRMMDYIKSNPLAAWL